MQIHTAAAQGDREAILRELASGIDVDTPDADGLTPLMRAAWSAESDVETMQLLLDQGADPNAVGKKYPSPVLWKALIRGDPSRVQCLLEAGADVNFVDEDEMDALMVITNEQYEVQHERPLSLLNLLLERGISVSRKSEDGLTALEYAFDYGSFGLVKRLLEAGADETPLEWNPLVKAIVVGTADEVREQLEQGNDLSYRDCWEERTPWLLSVVSGDVEKAKLLLLAGASLNEVGCFGDTALIYAIRMSNFEMLRWLLSIGCDVNVGTKFGTTALMKAAEQNSLPFVQTLLDAGADPGKEDQSRRKAIDHTTSLDIVHLLLPTGHDLSDLKPEVRKRIFGAKDTISLTREDVETGWNPRFGTANPERMDVALWRARVLYSCSYEIPQEMYPSSYEGLEVTSPVWYYPRFVTSLTKLPDGRFIEIGGEVEDSYDDDFYIYNDVFVHNLDGTTDIYGYPSEVFPPTDGHSATLTDAFIYIIGCIGYVEQRIAGYTPVYRLNTETLAIECVETTGDNPGWIFKHKAVLVGDEIHISGGEHWTGPPTEEENAKNFEAMKKLANFPVQEDFSSINDFLKAMGQHMEENEIKKVERPERFILNLKSLQWRRDA